MILAIQQNSSLKTILASYVGIALVYGFNRGYTYTTRASKKGNEIPEPTSLTQNFFNAITLGVSSVLLIPFNLKRILTRQNGDNDIL